MFQETKIPRTVSSVFLNIFLLSFHVHAGLLPYYLHFPPPPPLGPVPNGIEPDFSHFGWPQYPPTFTNSGNSSTTRDASLSGGPIPLVVHTWVKPDGNPHQGGTTLQNGTVIYYVAGPWGGIRTASPSSPQPPTTGNPDGIVSNSITDYPTPTVSQDGKTVGTRSQGHQGNSGLGLVIDITTPSSNTRREQSQDQGPWGHGHMGFGWPTSTQLYDNKTPEPTTNPSRSQTTPGSSTTAARQATTTPTGTRSTTTQEITTPDPIAANTDARFPVSDSVRKFRRIVAQIRAITKKELSTKSPTRSRG